MKRINSTRFLTQDELAERLTVLDMDAQNYDSGGIPLLVKDKKIYVDISDSHTMIYGATGSKKTRMFAMPSIGIFARAGESFVATDPKGELFEQTAGDVKEQGYEICCLNLRDFRKGKTWNPLALPYRYYHHGQRTKAIELATQMSTMLVDMDSSEEKFWTNTAVDIFTGFILILFEEAKEEECHLKSLAELWNEYVRNRKETIQKIMKKYKGTVIQQKLSCLNNQSEKTVGSMEAFISMGLNKLVINEEFMQFLSMKGIDLETLTEGKKAIYLIIPDENRSYHFAVSLFLEQLYEVLIRKSQQMKNHRLPVRMNFLIDEFGNLPRLENMDAMITASRSRNIRFHLIVQGMEQLRYKYGKEAETISGNCNNWVYLYSREYQLLSDISRLCGEVIYDNHVKMPLFSEFDLQHLNKEEGEALVLAGRNYPCLSRLADISEYSYSYLGIKEEFVSEWEELEVCGGFTSHQERYILPISLDKMISKNFMSDFSGRRWLTAVGPENMIVGEGLYSETEILSKFPIGNLGYQLQKNEGIDPKDLKWYYASARLEKEYKERLKANPEQVYLTLDDLGISRFKKVEGISSDYDCRKKKVKYRLQIVGMKDYDSDIGEKLYQEDVETCEGVLGLRHVYNKLFRTAGQMLKGTDLEELFWKEIANKPGEICFRKKTDEGLCVYACVKENSICHDQINAPEQKRYTD